MTEVASELPNPTSPVKTSDLKPSEQVSPIDRRREKLLALRRQEQMKGVLLRKFAERYGAQGRSASCGKCPQSVIRSEVNAFLKNATISERNLGRLERRIQKFALEKQFEAEASIVSNYSTGSSYISRGSRTASSCGVTCSALSKSVSGARSQSNLHAIKEDDSHVQFEVQASREGDAEPSDVSPSRIQRSLDHPSKVSQIKSNLSGATQSASRTSTGFSSSMSDTDSMLDERRRRPKRTAPFSWAVLDDYAAWAKQQDAQKLKRQHYEGQQSLRVELDRQVSESRLKNERRREEDLRYYRHQVMEMEAFKEREQAQHQHRREVMARDAETQVAQLKFVENQRREEEERKKNEDSLILKQVQYEAELDKQRLLEKKKTHMEHMQKMFAQNRDERARKEEDVKTQQMEDMVNIKKYNKLLEQQDQDRGAEVRARSEKQKALMNLMDSDMFATQANQGKEIERRAQKQAQELNERAERMDREKQNRLRQRKQETQEYQLSQMAAKADIRQNTLKSKEVQLQMLVDDAAEYSQHEATVAKNYRDKNIRNREILQEQMSIKRNESTNMTNRELEFNRDLIDRVEASGLPQ